MKKFNIGDKVVPISKSVCGTLQSSNVWRKAQTMSQGFIYITGYDGEVGHIVCNEEIRNYVTGDYFLESDLVPYTEEMASKNAQELIGKLETLVGEANVAIQELKGLQEDTPVVAAHARQQIIDEAKAFVEKYRAVKKGDSSHDEGNETAQCHYYEADFIKKGNKITALVYHLDYGVKRSSNKPNRLNRAKCAPDDTFNQHIGEAIALGRALDINVDKFIKAVQPTEFAVGQVIEFTLLDEANTEVITSIVDNKAYVDTGGFHWLERVKQDNFKILDDTNATYEA